MERGVTEISDLVFGKGYLTESLVGDYTSSAQRRIIQHRVSGKLVGVSLIGVFSRRELKDELFVSDSVLKELTGTVDLIGYRKATIIHPEFQGKGISKQLVTEGNEWFRERKVPIILSAVWSKNGKSAFGELLKEFGFEAQLTVPEYWREDSVKREFQCILCGEPPCRCEATIYRARLT